MELNVRLELFQDIIGYRNSQFLLLEGLVHKFLMYLQSILLASVVRGRQKEHRLFSRSFWGLFCRWLQ